MNSRSERIGKSKAKIKNTDIYTIEIHIITGVGEMFRVLSLLSIKIF